jgi:hypothetical protein
LSWTPGKGHPLRTDAQLDQQVGEPDVGHPLDRHPDGHLRGLGSSRHDLHVADRIGPYRKEQRQFVVGRRFHCPAEGAQTAALGQQTGEVGREGATGPNDRLGRHRQGRGHRRPNGIDPGIEIAELDAVPGTGEGAGMPTGLEDVRLVDPSGALQGRRPAARS